MTGDRPVVVGIDGSASALDAARWAAPEAARRGTAVQLISAFDWVDTGCRSGVSPPVRRLAAVENDGPAEPAGALTEVDRRSSLRLSDL